MNKETNDKNRAKSRVQETIDICAANQNAGCSEIMALNRTHAKHMIQNTGQEMQTQHMLTS
jgi:hypothetical protein